MTITEYIMKKTLISLLFTAVLGILAGCTKSGNIIYEDGIASKVYFVQAATAQVAEVSEESLDESGTVAFCIYNAGNNEGDITVSVSADPDALDIYNIENGTSYQMLPEKYWYLAGDTFVMDTRENYQAFVPVYLDFVAMRTDAIDAGSYLLPLSVSTPDLNNITYDYKTLFVKIVL